MNEYLEQGIIQPSKSAWNAPIWIVPKKIDQTGVQKWRIVIDYCKLNEITYEDKFPLPNIEDIFDSLCHAKIFTTIDLASGFHQIPIHPEDKEKTAFSTANNHYEFNKMPFGMVNSPATFQQVMNQALTGLIGSECLVYLDDIIIYSHNFPSHLQKLQAVFQRLQQHGLLIQPDKTEFAKNEVLYLGHTISSNGLSVQKPKVDKILNFPRPTDVTSLQHFLGLTGYYQRFIPNYSQKTRSLSELTKKNQTFEWTEKRKEDFENLRRELGSPNLILQFPDFTKDFFLNTDASNYAIGAVLSQEVEEKQLKPLSFASRTLNKPEINYATIEKELLAIIWACKQFRSYLYGRKFTILSDHKPLQWLFNINDPGSRLLHWRLKLAEYHYEIKHISGTKNTVADALSRINIITRSGKITEMPTKTYKEEKTILRFTSTENSRLEPGEIQKKDKEIFRCYKVKIMKYSTLKR